MKTKRNSVELVKARVYEKRKGARADSEHSENRTIYKRADTRCDVFREIDQG